MKISIVIVNYNVKHFLEQCLRSVEKAIKQIDAEVFVVDNNSVDGSNDMVRNSFPWVKLIANDENVGFSSANNQAIKQSQGEYVLLLNPDTVVPENCFQKILAFMDKTLDAGGCGIHMVDGKGKFLPESKRGLPTPEVALYKMIGLNKLFPKSQKFGKYHLGYLAENENHKVDILSGAFMLMRKSVLDEIGLLDETFFMYGEDIDLSYRITQAGYSNYYFAETSIIHYKGESTKKLSTNYVKVFYKAMIIFAEKHYAGNNKFLFTSFINLAIYARASLTLVANFFRKYWLVLVELFVIFGAAYYLKEYWEEHIRLDIKEYPREMTYHLQSYTLIWLLSLWFSGSYANKYDFSKIIKGTLIGTLIILSIYGLLPDDLRFSRGIILFGSLVVIASLFAVRTLLHLMVYKSLNFGERSQTKSILVGTFSKWQKVSDLLKSYSRSYEHLGFVSDQKEDSKFYLGTVSQLEEIKDIYGVNEVIFSGDTISSEEVMKWMHKMGPEINYFTIPPGSDFVIGSHSKNGSGLYFGEQIELNLSKPHHRRQKRIFDLGFALLVLLLFPISLLFSKGRTCLNEAYNVLIGRKTWVGYSSHNVAHLPKLRTGVFATDYMLESSINQYQENLDKLYAKNYTLSKDVSTILAA